MKFADLFKFYESDYYRKDAETYSTENNIKDIEIDSSIADFIEKFKHGEEIKSEEFEEFVIKLDQLKGDENGEKIRSVIIHMLTDIAVTIYEKNKEEIDEAVTVIEQNINKKRNVPQDSPQTTKFMGLVNIYHLFAQNISLKESGYGYRFPNIGPHFHAILDYEVAFAINALTVTGKLPKMDINGVDTAKALYPITLEVTKASKEPIRKGIKNSDEYYPYKQAKKIAKGDTGNNTFLATNGSKSLYIRGVERYAPEGILASKIATMVSAEHFASERLMDNQVVGSRGIDSYACSAADPATRDARIKYINTDKKVFPGTGIIDEVNNYTNERDPNTENLGFSSTDFSDEKTHLSKIDFDRCYPSVPTTKEQYEADLVTKFPMGIYKNLSHIHEDKNYIHEKLYARLKLSLITEDLLRGLANKAFLGKDQEMKEETIQQCVNKSNIALELFWEHPEVKQFLKENPQIVDQCHAEMITYIQDHFEEKDQQVILASLQSRCDLIHSQQDEILYTTKKLSSTHYEHEVDSSAKSRFHALAASTDKDPDLKNTFHQAKGDYLKSLILSEFKSKIEQTRSETDLDNLVEELQSSSRYKILSTGQGIVTRLSERLTSSEKAFSKMVQEQRTNIQNKLANPYE